MVEKIKKLYKEWRGVAPLSAVRLTGDGSNRVYFRLSSQDDTVIGVVGTSADENRVFVTKLENFSLYINKRTPQTVAIAKSAVIIYFLFRTSEIISCLFKSEIFLSYMDGY